MGAGKSSIGKKVAKLLGRAYVDTDAMVVRDHGVIAEIFVDKGEAYFRELERQAVATALQSGGVVALGGGAVLLPASRELLTNHDVVLLTVQPRVVAGRIAMGGRPLLEGDEDPLTRWIRIRNERMPLYEEVADVTFDTSTGRIQAVVDDIADWAKRRNA